MLLSASTKLGPYEILAPIGAGGMGEVYKARDTRLDRFVAIKVSKEKFSARFECEARAVAALNHPNICQLYDFGHNYLVMEFIEGAPLKGPLPLDKALDYACQILAALDAAHQKGITHRDLKPANILVTKQGIKLLDFGLAKQSSGPLKETDVTEALTTQGQIVGTLQYMSPEQLQSRPIDQRSDLFSFGCVLYEMLTGEVCFEGKSAASVIAAILDREPAPLTATPQLGRIISRCLAKDPDHRFQSARDLKTALLWTKDQQPAAAPVRRPYAIAVSLLIAALVGWAFGHFRQPAPDDRVLSLQLNPPSGTHYVFGSNTGTIALSPDGKNLAFIATGNGKNGLWVRSLDSTEAHLIPGTENAGYPFWSPDSKSVGFFAASTMKRADLAGGSLRTICDVPGGRDGDWSSDGQILFSVSRSGLFLVPVTGGNPTILTTPEPSRGEFSHTMPRWLPGGRFIYRVLSDRPNNNGGIYLASLAKPNERVRLLDAETNAVYARGSDNKDYLLWVRGQTLLAQQLDGSAPKLLGEPQPIADPVGVSLASYYTNATVSTSGLLVYRASSTISQPTWFDRNGKSLGEVGDPEPYWMYRFSPDGRRLAAIRDNALWLLDVDRGVSTRFTDNVRPMFPLWSPDGRTIVYLLSIPRELWRKDSSAAIPAERILVRSDWTLTDWSHDGSFLLFTIVDPKTLRDLWTLPVATNGKVQPDAQPKLYLRTQFNEAQGRFSPEQTPHWIAYQSDESGRYEIYIQSFPEPHGAIRISTGGGQYPEWSPDGRELFYISPDYRLMAVSIKLGPNSVRLGTPQPLFTLPVDDLIFSPYEVSPDGQRFLVRASSRQASPLTVIVNWPALLKKGAAPP